MGDTVDGWKALDIDPESLRGQTIEAGARKFYEIMSARGPTDLTFDVAYPDEQADFLRVTAQVFDAILSVLSERADEAPGHSFESWTVADLLAVLRGDKED